MDVSEMAEKITELEETAQGLRSENKALREAIGKDAYVITGGRVIIRDKPTIGLLEIRGGTVTFA
jgi:hypothetical protein